MAVDIFYQELSYEEIEQNVAFEFLSLLSEIGGFLGLLWGASVLTDSSISLPWQPSISSKGIWFCLNHS